MEERNGFSIIGFIAQVLIILLVIFILMWLFPTKNYLNNNIKNETNTDLSSEILFNQNLLSMKDAAREYYTISRMPSKDGDSKMMTLGEMIEKQMVVSLIGSDGTKCSTEASYVKVTKVDKEYEMIVSLTCSGVTKTIKTTVGCYNYCGSGLCEKDNTPTTTEYTIYEYKKIKAATEGWTNWSSWSKTKVTATSTRQVETKTEKVQDGTTTSYIDADVTVTKKCETGYTLVGEKCVSTKNETDTKPAKVSYNYNCNAYPDYTLEGTRCVKKTSSYVGYDKTYGCENSSYTYNSRSNTCTKTSWKNATPHVKVSFTCEDGPCKTVSKIDYYYCSTDGYKLSGKKCYKTTTGTVVVKSQTCPSGYTASGINEVGKECVKTSTSTKAATAVSNKYCEDKSYTLSGDNCIKATSSTVYGKVIEEKNYSCKTGTLSGTKCAITEPKYINVTYYRYRDYYKTEAETLIKWSKSSNDQTLIKQGYKYTGVSKTVSSSSK